MHTLREEIPQSAAQVTVRKIVYTRAMSNVLDDPRILQVVLEEYEKHKLPRMITIKESVDGGERLDAGELAFLRELYREINSYEPFVEGHPEFKELYVSFVRLYCSIMDAALDNEQRK